MNALGLRIGLAALALVASVTGGEAAQPGGMELFPTAQGARWDYDIKDGQTVTTMSSTVVSALKVGADTFSEIHLVRGGRTSQIEKYVLNSTGLSRKNTGPGGVTGFEPPMPMIRFPAVVGATWDWTGMVTLDKTKGAAVGRGRIGALETVETKAGKFKAYRVDTELVQSMRGTIVKTATSTWYAAGIGIIKLNFELRPPNGKVVRMHASLIRYKIK
jgi:hypothetical protein